MQKEQENGNKKKEAGSRWTAGKGKAPRTEAKNVSSFHMESGE